MQVSRTRAGQGLGAGLMFICLGGLGLWFGRGLAVGSAQEMGPGYAPALVCWGMVLVGTLVLARSLLRGTVAIEAASPRAVFGIVAALGVFAATIGNLGLVLSSLVTVAVACLIEPKLRWKEVALLSAGLSIAAVVLFVFVLRIPFRTWPV
ncbi:MAG: tripartite tricarboxylate transporter TctB family protein [Burkholderiales bacterium]|nr:tripartite tricarboxylate transporter TctB family protein [Burkholderiales bacterium]